MRQRRRAAQLTPPHVGSQCRRRRKLWIPMTSNDEQNDPTANSAAASDGSVIAVTGSVNIVDATVHWPGHGRRRLRNMRGEVKVVGEGVDPDIRVLVRRCRAGPEGQPARSGDSLGHPRPTGLETRQEGLLGSRRTSRRGAPCCMWHPDWGTLHPVSDRPATRRTRPSARTLTP